MRHCSAGVSSTTTGATRPAALPPASMTTLTATLVAATAPASEPPTSFFCPFIRCSVSEPHLPSLSVSPFLDCRMGRPFIFHSCYH